MPRFLIIVFLLIAVFLLCYRLANYMAAYITKRWFGREITKNFDQEKSKVTLTIASIFIFAFGFLPHFALGQAIDIEDYVLGSLCLLTSSCLWSLAFFIFIKSRTQKKAASKTNIPSINVSHFILLLLVTPVVILGTVAGAAMVSEYLLATIHGVNSPFFIKGGIVALEVFWTALFSIGIWKVFDRSKEIKNERI